MAKNSTNRYSLADYELVVTFPSNFASTPLETSTGELSENGYIRIGGPNGQEGSFVGSINIKRNKDLWTTDGDPTGSWVHSMNLDRTGLIDVEISFVSDQVIQLIYLCDAYDSVEEVVEGLTINVTNRMSGKTVVSATDCYIIKIPDFGLKDTPDKLTFSFTCGRILFFK